MLLEFYDYGSSHYLEYETDEILIDGETIEQRDTRIRQEFFNKIKKELPIDICSGYEAIEEIEKYIMTK